MDCSPRTSSESIVRSYRLVCKWLLSDTSCMTPAVCISNGIQRPHTAVRVLPDDQLGSIPNGIVFNTLTWETSEDASFAHFQDAGWFTIQVVTGSQVFRPSECQSSSLWPGLLPGKRRSFVCLCEATWRESEGKEIWMRVRGKH
jgi:hypothetical protein